MGQSQADLDNHANQLNPNNDAYWSSRGCGSGDDDDDTYGGGSTWTPTYSPAYNTARHKEQRTFAMETVSDGGEVQRWRVAIECWPEDSQDSAAQRAAQHLHEKCWVLACRARPEIRFWRVLDAAGATVFESRPVHLQLRGFRAEQVTLPLVQRMKRTIDYREQADRALQEFKTLVEQARDTFEALPVFAPAGCRAATWKRLRADLLERFTPPSTTSPCDFAIAREQLQRLGVSCDGIASHTRAEDLCRRHDVLLRASVHRSPPPNEYVLCVGQRPDAYVEYFQHNNGRVQVDALGTWFSRTEPAIRKLLKAKPRMSAKDTTDLGTVPLRSW